MDVILKELRYAGRMLRKNPGLTGVAVMALAFGIGFTTIMFSIVNAALIRGLPFEGADKIMHLERANPSAGIESMGVSIHDYRDWRDQQRAFGDLGAFRTGTVNVSGTERPVRFDGAFQSANTFSILGVSPILGRDFRPEEERPGAERVMLIGHHVWRDRFNGDPDVVGTVVRANGEPTTIIGVMPGGFRFPILQDVWLTDPQNPLELERGAGFTLEVFGRLANGYGADRALVEMNGIADRLATAYPESNEGVSVLMQPFTREFIGDEAVGILLTMLAAVFLVLLIACANVANLLLARAAVRSKELAVRTAMGASRGRIVFQLLTEALALAAVGAILGTGIAWVGVEMFDRAVQISEPPYWLAFSLDVNVLLFVTGVTVIAALASGLLPAIQATRSDVSEIIKDESRGSSGFRVGRLSRTLVIAEVAFSMGLLVAAGLMVRSVMQLRNLEYPFATERLFTARVGLFENDYPDVATRQRFWRDLQHRLEAIPGARGAALTNALPGLGSGGGRFQIEGRSYATDEDVPFTRQVIVTPGFFDAVEMEILQGRDFTWQDDSTAQRVAVANQSFAQRYFEGERVVGKRIRWGGLDSEGEWFTIIGLVPDSYMSGLGDPDDDPEDGLFVSLAQDDVRFLSIAVLAGADPFALTPVVREAVAAVDPNLPIYWVDTLAGQIETQTWFYRIFGTLFMVFGGVALFMASVGLYGVMAFSVSNRTAEMGIRMALGAGGRDVLGLVLKQGAGQLAIGLALGLVLAAFLSQAMQMMFFEVSPRDPVTFSLVAVVLAGAGMLASLIPARRATRVDPMESLRYEG